MSCKFDYFPVEMKSLEVDSIIIVRRSGLPGSGYGLLHLFFFSSPRDHGACNYYCTEISGNKQAHKIYSLEVYRQNCLKSCGNNN